MVSVPSTTPALRGMAGGCRALLQVAVDVEMRGHRRVMAETSREKSGVMQLETDGCHGPFRLSRAKFRFTRERAFLGPASQGAQRLARKSLRLRPLPAIARW